MSLTAIALTATSHLWPTFPGTRTDGATSAHAVAAGVFDMSAGRLGAVVAAAVGLVGIVLGGRALVRSAGRTRSARIGMVLGLIAVALGGLVMATSDGSLGTGNGLGGAVVAAVAGSVAVVLGGLAQARARGVASRR